MGRYDGKTEKGTEQRRSKAREEGQAARSQELTVALSLVAFLMVIRVVLPVGMTSFAADARRLLLSSSRAEIDPDLIGQVAGGALVQILGPVLALAVVAAIISGVS